MISIAVCTYNRANQLAPLMRQLGELCELSEELTEVLVVNNGGDTATSTLLQQLEHEKIRELIEPKLGLSNARNKALLEFKSENIWFLDDDTSVTSTAPLKAYLAALRSFTSTGYFGGPIYVDWEEGKPSWLGSDQLPLLDGLFGRYTLGSNDQVLENGSLGPYGANFVLRRELIERVGTFNPSLGVRAASLGRGEETDYFRRANSVGITGRYITGAAVGHRFQLERINLPYLWRYGLAKGKEQATTGKSLKASWVKVAADQLLRGSWQLIKGRRDRFYQAWINMGVARGRHLVQRERERS